MANEPSVEPEQLRRSLSRAPGAGASASVTTVLVALGASLLVALAKTVAAVVTRSASIVAEAAHSGRHVAARAAGAAAGWQRGVAPLAA
jgi:hypothetical protein